MTALVRAELIRLRRTRTTWGLAAAALIMVMSLVWIVLADVGGIAGFAPGSTQLRDAVAGAAGVGQLPVLLLGVLAVTGEFHHRTATSTFLVTSRRSRVVAAKAIACVVFALPVAAALIAVPLGIGVLTGAVEVAADADLGLMVLRTLLVFACWALLGVAVGAAIRNQTVAVVAPLMWFGLVEQLLPSYDVGWLLPWLPGGVTSALAGGEFPGALPAPVALLILLAYAGVLLAPGTRAIVRADIT